MSGVREEMMDEDGYPTEETLTTVATWRGDFPVLMDYLRLAWHFGEWYWTEEATERGRRYSISTAGWSGNESLIAAMQDNTTFWMVCWQEHRRGGHYVFEIRNAPIADAGADETNKETSK